jgi:hypothetical protein
MVFLNACNQHNAGNSQSAGGIDTAITSAEPKQPSILASVIYNNRSLEPWHQHSTSKNDIEAN